MTSIYNLQMDRFSVMSVLEMNQFMNLNNKEHGRESCDRTLVHLSGTT